MPEVDVLKFDYQGYQAYLALARRCLAEHHVEQAVEHVRRAIGADPSRPEAFNLLGCCCELYKIPLEAQKYYRAALSLDPSYGPAQRNLHRLVSYHSRGQIDVGILPKSSPRSFSLR